MIEHVWSLLCKSSAVDKESNSLSIFNTVEAINATASEEPPEVALIPIPLQFVSLWTRSDPETPSGGDIRIGLIAPNGDQLGQASYEVDLLEHRNRRVRINFPGFTVRGSGRHAFHVEKRNEADGNWELVAKVPVDVKLDVIEAPPADTPAVNPAATD